MQGLKHVVSRQECERQQCERHQCEANSANANSAKGSTVRMPTVRMRQRCECQLCECDSSAKDDSPNCAKPIGPSLFFFAKTFATFYLNFLPKNAHSSAVQHLPFSHFYQVCISKRFFHFRSSHFTFGSDHGDCTVCWSWHPDNGPKIRDRRNQFSPVLFSNPVVLQDSTMYQSLPIPFSPLAHKFT